MKSERNCKYCIHSREVAGVHRMCEHPDAPEKPPYERELHNALAYLATEPPDWCPLERADAKTQVHATVRVIVAMDVEVTWRDGAVGMVEAAKDACLSAEHAVGEALGGMADNTDDRVKMAKGASPKAEARRVSAKLEIR